MLDHLITGGTVVDGTGAAPRLADVAVRDGRIVAIAAPGEITESAANIDATGQLVIPGVIDPHTHYDAQLFWDPGASPSNVHGVTTVIGGNCGFTLAPLRAEDAAYTREFMASVEGMSVAALEEGVPWNWETFAEYLDRLEGNVGVNAGFLVGHNALRRYVMGAASVGSEATAEQVAAMQSLLAESIEAGGLGFSTTLSRTHSDGDGQPVASRWATTEEILALCEVVGAHPGTTLEAMTDGCLDQFSDEEIELFSDMSATAKRPLNWNVLTVDSREPARIPRQLSAGDRAAEKGGRIVALTLPVQVPMNMSFLNHCGLFLIPGWKDVLGLPVAERIVRLQKPRPRRGCWSSRSRLRPGCSSAWPTSRTTSSGTPTPPPTRASRAGASVTSQQSVARMRSRPSSTSWWPTSCAPSCGRSRPMATMRHGSCAARPGQTTGRCSAARTPVPTWIGCAGPRSRPASWATPSAAASWCASSGRSS